MQLHGPCCLPLGLESGSQASGGAVSWLSVTCCSGTHLSVPALQHIRDIQDPEHPYSLEQLHVVAEDLINIDDSKGHVK